MATEPLSSGSDIFFRLAQVKHPAIMANDGKEKDTKGKGKAINQDGDDRDGDNGALLSRIAKSAASLPSALFPSDAATGTLSQLGTSEKGQSSRVGESLARAGQSSVEMRPSPATGEAIKPRQTQEHIAMEEAAFSAFLDTTNTMEPSETMPGLETAFGSEMLAGRAPAASRGATFGFSSVAEQEAHDGEGVLALLSADTLPEDDEPEDETMLQADLSALRKALFGDHDGSSGGSSSSVAWDHALNFIPPSLRGAGDSMIGKAADLVGTADPNEGWESWVDQWSRVLTDYNDEVWGDLGTLVKEARREVEQLERAKDAGQDRPPTEPSALLRLRAILGHLRGA